MSKKQNGLLAALEDADEIIEETIVEVPADEAPEALLEVAENAEEVQEGVAAIESLALAIEEATDEVEEVANVLDTVEEVAGGEEPAPVEGENLPAEPAPVGDGLTEGEAVLAEEAFRQAFRRLNGAVNTPRLMPSMENFKSTNSRRTATRIGLENVMDTIRSVWEKIVAAINTLWTKIQELWKKFTDANASLEKAAKALKDKVAATKGDAPTGEASEFESERLSGMFPTSDALKASDVLGYVSTHLSLIGTVGAGVNKMKALYDDVVTSLKSSSDAVNARNISAAAAIKEIVAMCDIKGTLDLSVGEHSVSGTHVYVGGNVIEFKYDIKSADKDEVSATFSLGFQEMDKRPENTKVAVASLDDLKAVCDKVLVLAKENGELVKNMEAMKKSVDTMIASVSKWASASNKDGNSEQLAALRERGRVVTSAARSTGTLMSSTTGQNIRAGRAAVAFVSACLGKY